MAIRSSKTDRRESGLAHQSFHLAARINDDESLATHPLSIYEMVLAPGGLHVEVAWAGAMADLILVT